MNVRETPSHKTTVTTGTSLSANLDRKKLMISNVPGGSNYVYVTFSSTTPTSSAFDMRVVVNQSETVENYVGEVTATDSVRFVEFT